MLHVRAMGLPKPLMRSSATRVRIRSAISDRGCDRERFQQAPGKQEPAGRTVIAAPCEKRHDQREHRGAGENQIAYRRDHATQLR